MLAIRLGRSAAAPVRCDPYPGEFTPYAQEEATICPPHTALIGTTNLRESFLLDPGIVYLNHGSFGACPRPVFEAYQEWQRTLERQPVKFMQRREPLLREAREALGAYLHADADDLVYVTNVSLGLNVIARSLPLAPGDEVLTTDHEYGSMNRMWGWVCEKRG
ncbi:MAG: aminotransferase class V-fold PLP-dependent enzyme, partial [Anaerolineae bacterium]